MPLISVIIPAYNAETTLPAAIESVLSSTHDSLELIAVNDGSTDSTEQIISEYVAQDERVRLISKQNGGVSSARNAALDAARGDYVAFLDADDRVAPDAYEYMLNTLLDADADIVQCASLYGDSLVLCSPPSPVVIEGLSVSREAGIYLFGGACCKLFRRAILDGVRFSERYKVGEDVLFCLEAMKRARKTVLTDGVKYYYTDNPSSATHNLSDARYLSDHCDMLDFAEIHLSAPEVLDFLRTERIRWALNAISKMLRARTVFRDVEERARKTLRLSLKYAKGHIGFTKKDRMKMLMICYAYTLYKLLIPKSH